MTTKVKPTVEKWERDFYADLADNEWIIDDPYSPDMVQMPFHELEKRVHTLLSSSVQEAKAERDKEIFQWLQDEGEISQYDKERLLASLKQEEEHA